MRVYGAIRRGKWSAPGPDGLAAGVWARFAPCVSLSFCATTFICNGGAAPPNLNASLAVYIPKKGVGTVTHGLQARASEARPLALKDAAARVIWRVLARSLMPALQEWAHFSQRRFISGRIPGHGVIDIDTSARIVSVLHPLGALGIF